MKTKLMIMLVIVFGLYSCEKEGALPKDTIFDLGGERWKRTDIDNLIYKDFTKPYNIEIKYKWNPYELNHNRTLVPIRESQVPFVLKAIKTVWMEPYEKVGSKNFLRQFPFLKFILTGSPEFQSDGSEIMGLAEGGAKIILFNMNEFLIDNRPSIENTMHTVHHEFAHILHQTIHYPEEWRGISTQWYTPTWFNSDMPTANAQGLITPYAKSSEREDFVETITYLLIHGQDEFDWIVDEYKDAAHIFRLKESLIVKYFKDAFNIDFRELQKEVEKGISKIVL